ncbi:MAG: hypothetical protein ABI813_06760 [Bacteroidota bacterium]
MLDTMVLQHATSGAFLPSSKPDSRGANKKSPAFGGTVFAGRNIS